MVVLHYTRKRLARLPLRPQEAQARAAGPAESIGRLVAGSTAASPPHLGDWYATIMVVARRPLVLLAAERSLLAVVLPLRESRTLVARWQQSVERRLHALGIAEGMVAVEMAAIAEVRVVPISYGAGADPDAPGASLGSAARQAHLRRGRRRPDGVWSAC